MPTAFVLNADELAGSDAMVFPGFPGVWTAGRPIEADEFVKAGAFATVAEMAARVEELGLPLEEVDVDAGDAPMPERFNHLPSQSEATAEVVEETVSKKNWSHAEADERARELGFEFSASPRPKVAEKLEAILAIEVGEPQTLATPIHAGDGTEG